MEATGLILGIQGFIAVVLQTYLSVVRSISSYRNLPGELQTIINSIAIEEALFAGYVDLLLATYMAEEDRTELVQTRRIVPEPSQFHAEIRSWEDRFHKLKQDLTEQRKVQGQDGAEVDVDPDEFRTILLEMELIKEVGIALEAIKEIENKYLKKQENEVVEASRPQDGHMGSFDLAKRRLISAVCLTHTLCRKAC